MLLSSSKHSPESPWRGSELSPISFRGQAAASCFKLSYQVPLVSWELPCPGPLLATREEEIWLSHTLEAGSSGLPPLAPWKAGFFGSTK